MDPVRFVVTVIAYNVVLPDSLHPILQRKNIAREFTGRTDCIIRPASKMHVLADCRFKRPILLCMAWIFKLLVRGNPSLSISECYFN